MDTEEKKDPLAQGQNKQAEIRRWVRESLHGLFVAVGLLTSFTVIGTTGFMIVEDYTLHEALYMTIITISTVGYGEVKPLSTNGQMFAAGLILVGMCGAAYAFGIIGRTLLEGELKRFREIYKMQKQIAALEDHFIICGYGRLSRYIIPELRDQEQKVVVIESDPMIHVELEIQGIPYVEGNAFDDEVLRAAGIERATALLAILPNDADNVYTTLSARYLNKKVRIIARSEALTSEGKLRLAGADQIIAPYRVSSTRVVQQLLHQNVNDFLEILCDRDGTALVIEQLIVPDDSSLCGQTLMESQIRQKTHITVAACINGNGEMLLNPNKDSVIEPGATLVAIGTRENMEKFSELI